MMFSKCSDSSIDSQGCALSWVMPLMAVFFKAVLFMAVLFVAVLFMAVLRNMLMAVLFMAALHGRVLRRVFSGCSSWLRFMTMFVMQLGHFIGQRYGIRHLAQGGSNRRSRFSPTQTPNRIAHDCAPVLHLLMRGLMVGINIESLLDLLNERAIGATVAVSSTMETRRVLLVKPGKLFD